MLRKLSYVVAVSALCMTGSASAEEIVKWVDADGITHFGNAQFAPRGEGEPVEVRSANGMHAPSLRILDRAPASRQLKGVVVERARNKNPRGWRGYWKRNVTRNGNRRG